MKRAFVILLLLAVASSAFAVGTGTLSENFMFKAYYDREQATQWVDLNIYDRNRSMQNAGIIQLADPVVVTEQSAGTGDNQNPEVFVWELEGNYCNQVTIKFNFLPLQAFKTDENNVGLYYIPKHTFTLTMTNTVFPGAGGTEMASAVYDFQKYRKTGNPKNTYYNYTADTAVTIPFDHEKESGTYPYLSYGNSGFDVEFRGTICNKNTTTMHTGDYSRSTWKRSGVCTLRIEDYDHTVGEFDYVADIRVIVTVNI